MVSSFAAGLRKRKRLFSATKSGSLTPLLLGIFHLAKPEHRFELHEVNGSLSLVVWENDVLMLVMNFEIVDSQIICIRNIINPEKLSFISHSPTPPVGSDIPAAD